MDRHPRGAGAAGGGLDVDEGVLPAPVPGRAEIPRLLQGRGQGADVHHGERVVGDRRDGQARAGELRVQTGGHDGLAGDGQRQLLRARNRHRPRGAAVHLAVRGDPGQDQLVGAGGDAGEGGRARGAHFTFDRAEGKRVAVGVGIHSRRGHVHRDGVRPRPGTAGGRRSITASKGQGQDERKHRRVSPPGCAGVAGVVAGHGVESRRRGRAGRLEVPSLSPERRARREPANRPSRPGRRGAWVRSRAPGPLGRPGQSAGDVTDRW